jgi:hypothetical protein
MRVLLTRAIRKTRARGLNDAPSANEMDAALEDAQAFFMTLTNRELTDVLITANYTAGEDERITDLAGSYTVTRPTEITADDRPPRNGAIIEVTGTSPTRHVYVSELKAWSQVNGLALTSEQPFGPSLDEAVTDMVALRICDTVFQREPSQMLVQLATMGRAMFDARFHLPIKAQVDPGLRYRSDYLQTEEILS